MEFHLNFANNQFEDREAAEVNRRFEEVRRQSGKLRLAGQIVECQFEDLEYMEDIGHGSCGHVTKMKYNGQIMAVKQMARTGNSEASKRIIMDTDVVLKCRDCPNIVLCYGFFITENTVYVCMEQMATCLDRFLKRTGNRPVPERYIGKMAVSILKALNYLKETHNIIHRDVKPSNILLDWDGVVKLCDFGIAGKLIESRAWTRNAGCPPYMAPERLETTGGGSVSAYDVTSDVWSVGITLVELARGRYPYSHCRTEFEILTEIMQNPSPRLAEEEGFTPEFCNFIDLCLQKKPTDRPKYAVLLNHPFIQRSIAENTDVGAWFQDLMAVE